MAVRFEAMPEAVRDAISGVAWDETATPTDCAIGFFRERTLLASWIAHWRKTIAQDGMLWVCWPKKAAKVPTDITEDVVRDIALATGLVDVKVCAVDAVWSGLKLVIRKELRV